MVQKHNRSMSFSWYISALAVSDTVALLIGEYLGEKLGPFYNKRSHQQTQCCDDSSDTGVIENTKVTPEYPKNCGNIDSALTLMLGVNKWRSE